MNISRVKIIKSRVYVLLSILQPTLKKFFMSLAWFGFIRKLASSVDPQLLKKFQDGTFRLIRK